MYLNCKSCILETVVVGKSKHMYRVSSYIAFLSLTKITIIANYVIVCMVNIIS